MADLIGEHRGGRRGASGIEEIVSNRMCHGCGACAYACHAGAIRLYNFIDEGIRPVVDPARCDSCGDCTKVCSGASLAHDQTTWPTDRIEPLATTWGPIISLWEGRAGDEEVWFRGGSGGAATALSLYCLEKEQMYGVLHVGMDPDRPHLNTTELSTRRAELVDRTGSRYAPAAVCSELKRIEEAPGPVVLLGKPCDIASARKAAAVRPRLAERIGLTIAIFCAGTPSTRGVLDVLQKLQVRTEDISDMRFRGFGWPGMTGVGLKTPVGKRIEMTYREAWDTYLTKRKPWRCQICPDGTGEFADLSCGDPWYREINPGETGSSLLLARTPLGQEILHRAISSGYLVAEPRDPSVLPRSQIGQQRRRQSIWPKFFASAIFSLAYPRYGGFALWKNWSHNPFREQARSLYRALRYALSLRRRGSYRIRALDVQNADQIIDGKQCRSGAPKKAVSPRIADNSSS
jgi:coenzyme F420 hydrogenase subunit beta